MKSEFIEMHDVKLTKSDREHVMDVIGDGIKSSREMAHSVERIEGKKEAQEFIEQINDTNLKQKGIQERREALMNMCGHEETIGGVRQCLSDEVGDKAATGLADTASHVISDKLKNHSKIDW